MPSSTPVSGSSRPSTVPEQARPKVVREGAKAPGAPSEDDLVRVWELRKKGRLGPEWTVHELSMENANELLDELLARHPGWAIYQHGSADEVKNVTLAPATTPAYRAKAKEMLEMIKNLKCDTGAKQVFYHRNVANMLGSFDIQDGVVTTISEDLLLESLAMGAACGGVVIVRLFLDKKPAVLVALPASEAAKGHTCCSSGCRKPATVECPVCTELGVQQRYFCSQKCYDKGWKIHSRKRHGEYQCGMCDEWHSRDNRVQVRAFRFVGDDAELRRATPDKCQELWKIAIGLSAREKGKEISPVDHEPNSWVQFL
ncbi:hypothetical protein DFJ74DRAFT_771293 [Hyaloraphidium curvatum]|nr:hypothetical protein DFJ74DRAFT_771293 [Hyaloraphidium curvatum]